MHSLDQVVKRWVAGVALLVGLTAATALGVGMLLPSDHVVTRSLILSRAPEAAWRAITDSALVRAWRTDLASLERLPDSAGHARWREHETAGAERTVVLLEETAPVHRRIRRVEDGGHTVSEWEMTIARHPSGMVLTVTERGSIGRRWQRFVSQFTTGHAGPLERWLELLAAYFDEPARIN